MNNDPEYIIWLEDRHREAVAAQDDEMEKQHDEKRDYWLAKTAEENLPPC